MLPKMRYRLGLDIGAKSIGWAMIRLNAQDEPVALIKMGVRVFPDGREPAAPGKVGTSLAESRRLKRQMRRRRDRLLLRKRRMMQALIELGFFPIDEIERKALTTLDPYTLRKKALDEQLTPAEFARALFHINQRRGFKSNRKTDKKDNDSGALKTAIKRVSESLQEHHARTIGEWLANRHANREGVRARLRGKSVKDRAYDLYISRAMIEAEFDAIWAKQAQFDPVLFNESARTRLKDALLYQRPLKPVEPGRCTLLPEEPRAPLALPSVQRFRIYQEVNNLRTLDANLRDVPLPITNRDLLVQALERKAELSFNGMRKLLKWPGTVKFNLENTKRDRLKGNIVSVQLAKEDHFGDAWHPLSAEQQDQIAAKLINEESENALAQWLQDTFSLETERAQKIASIALKPDGYGNLSSVAIARILPKLQEEVIDFAKAVTKAGFDSHSALSHAEQTGEVMKTLPYYGEVLQRHVGFGSGKETDPVEKRFGRIANPTAHIGLNELRKVINALIKRYGNPSEVIVEVARDLKQSVETRNRIQEEQAKRQDENKDYREKIRDLINGAEPSVFDLQRYRLWIELNRNDPLNRCCPYTGEHIGPTMLFSDAVEIEHILPFSRTLDDSMNNKTVALRRANRDKTNQTPFEAFGHSPTGYDYTAILERAALMPEKARRFAPDAYERWLRDEKDFLARALNDTAYLSRVAKEYLMLVCHKDNVRVVPGRLTAMLRGKYGLNEFLSGSYEKNRNDHRHHAIDAAVIGITDQGLLQRFANANQHAREKGLRKLVENMPLPWPSFREQVSRGLQHIIVSFRPDHGYQGGLHNDTAYGLRADGRVAWRVPLDKFKNSKEVADTEFANPHFKEWLLKQVAGLDGKEFMQRIELIAREQGIRRARIVDTLKVIPIAGRPGTAARHGQDKSGQPQAYKGYKGDSNYCMEIWCNDKGKWEGEVISTFEANRIVMEKGWQALRNPKLALNGKPLVMRLMKGDYIKLSDSGKERLCVLQKMSGSGTLALFDHNQANVDARTREKSYSYIFKAPGSLQTANAKLITVNAIGEIGTPSRRTG
ncbi:MAG: type II CRISPR RNA-guided endonuclease Cas9 [Steroidobacteraceae bacterium]